MNTQAKDLNPPQTPEYIDDNVFEAVKSEVQHEIAHIRNSKEPVDSSQSDILVQKHVDGLFIIILGIVVLVLLAAIGGIWLYTHR